MIKPGTYNATVVSHAINTTKEGLPQATITFSFNADGPKTFTWYGSFKENAVKHTIKALLVCGLKGNNPAGDLEIGREVSIVIDDEQGSDGKTRTKIKWVNALGTVRNVIPADAGKAKLADLMGAVMAAREDLGIKESDEEIPF